MPLKIIQIIIAEFRRLLATPMSRLALVALAIVPLLYGGVYLWANQDPYAKLPDLPVALVVDDFGAKDLNGTYHNIGQQVADQLVKDRAFDWKVVGEREAARGVANGDYDFSVTLPPDFSENLLSVSHPNPRPASVIITTNDANSYLATTIGSHAATRIKAAVTQLVNEEAANRLLTGISQLRDGFVQAHDGAEKLADGTGQASEGSKKLDSGLGQLESATAVLPDKTRQLAAGAGQVAAGAQKLANASEQLKAGATQLNDGAGKLSQGAVKLADGAQKVADGNKQIAEYGDLAVALAKDGAAQVPMLRADLIKQLAAQGLSDDQIKQVLAVLDPITKKLTENVTKVEEISDKLDLLADGSQQVADGAKQLSSGAARLHDGTGKLAGGSSQLSDGANKLANGSVLVADGASKLAKAAPRLANGISQAHQGASALSSGLMKLDDGTKLLKNKLGDAVKQVPETDAAGRKSQAKGIAEPLVLNTHAVATAGSYGAGLAPFFLSLAAWIGMYALMLIMKPVSKRAITALRSPVRIAIAGWATPSVMGALQAVALYFVVSFALNFNISNPWLTLLFMMLTCFTYASIIVALNVWLGSVGQFLGLVLMVIQLVTAGGTFPWQTLPGPLAALHWWLPMSYSVDGMRQLMYGGSMVDAQRDAIFLAVVLGISLLLIALGVAKQSDHRTLRDLQPSLIG